MLKSLALLGLSVLGAAKHMPHHFGALHDDNSYSAALTNSHAFKSAVLAANSSETDRVVHVPQNARYTMMPVVLSDIFNVTFEVEGTVLCAQEFDNWPVRPDNGKMWDLWNFEDSSDLHLKGNGVIDGQGFQWWIREIMVQNPHSRPHLLHMHKCRNVVIEEITWLNSPMYHLTLFDIDNFLIQNLEIYVNIYDQKRITKLFGLFDTELNMPTFPLNTDGIDPKGSNVHIRNVKITNFDDAVAVKPATKEHTVSQDGCSQNILVEDVEVVFGVGMTIGSVPPSEFHTCVRNVTFRNIKFDYPLKAIYVKTNPGHVGTGEIVNILYENIEMNAPVWWAIYIGPQQQKQPTGDGPGCMLYPIVPRCDTQPRVTVANITLRNIKSTNGFFPPGIVRCNETNPCTGINFENVQMSGWWEYVGLGFISENVYGDVINTYPDPQFNQPGEPLTPYKQPDLLQFLYTILNQFKGLDYIKLLLDY